MDRGGRGTSTWRPASRRQAFPSAAAPRPPGCRSPRRCRLEDLLERGGGPGVAVTLDDQELVVVDREDLVDAVALAVELVEELPDRAALQVDLDEPIVGADALERGVQRAVLDECALHQAVELRAVGRDREPLHAAVRLAPADVGRQLDVAFR